LNFIITTAIALACLVAWEWSALDPVVSHWFGDAQGFAWRNHWLTTRVLHQSGRLGGWVCLGLVAMNIWRKAPLAPFNWFYDIPKRERVWLVLTTLACAAVVLILKRFSHSSCPWDFIEFGGKAAQVVSHWKLNVYDNGPGRCFPSGHASTGFSFLAAWFVLRPNSRQRAWIWICAVLALGGLFGLVQVARGAHFVSHALWTAMVCWVVSGVSAKVFLRR
jgi:membrane-associated PAP2 superfamily phosphatase